MIRKCIILLGLLIHVSCNDMSDGEKALANFTKKFNQEISKEYGLRLSGSGASFPIKLEYITLSFEADRCENIIGARQFAVEIAHKMIEKIQEDVNLQKYLSNTPATVKNIDLTIGFKEIKGNVGSLDSVMVIGVRNKIVYNAHDKVTTKLVDIYEETFDEAERIVKQKNVSK